MFCSCDDRLLGFIERTRSEVVYTAAMLGVARWSATTREPGVEVLEEAIVD